jgi:uncharacterized membrane protein YgcG
MASMDSRGRRTAAIWLLAPMSAYALSATTDWAIGHNPASPDAADAHSQQGKASVDKQVVALRARLKQETKEFNQTRRSLLQVQRDAHHRARQVKEQQRANAARWSAASSGSSSSSSSGSASYPSTSSSGGSSSGGSSGSGSAPAPAPPPPPAPTPPTNTSTGSS